MNTEKLFKEVTYKAVLSGGPGGQHANKTSTKVILQWKIHDSEVFNDEQKERLQTKLKTRINKEGVLQLSSSATRSQHANKMFVNQEFVAVLEEALKKVKRRKKTKLPKAVKLKRLEQKKRHAEKKASRKNSRLF